MEFDAVVEFERIGETIRRDGPALGEVADNLGIVLAIEFEQRRIVRGNGMHKRKRRVGIAVEVWRLGHHGERQRSAPLGAFCNRRLAARLRQERFEHNQRNLKPHSYSPSNSLKPETSALS